jgi:curved DNA-binding protein CbpA
MADPYAVLDLPADCTDDQVRTRYLQLVRAFPPEQHPATAAAVRAAYEAVRTLDARVRHRLFDAGADDTLDALIQDVRCPTPRRRFRLDELLTATAR